jgi:hypothetical protein
MQLLFILLGILGGAAVFAWWHRQRFGPLLQQVWHTIRWFWLALLVLLFLGRAALPILATAAGAPDAAGESPPWQLVVIEIPWQVLVYAGVMLPFLAGILLGRWRSSPSVRPDTDRFMGKLTDSLIGGVLLAITIVLSIQISLVAGGIIGALLSGTPYQFGMNTFETTLSIIGGVLGALGEVIGIEVAAAWRRRHQRGGAVAHVWVWGFRIGFLAFGACILVLWFISDYLGPIGPIQAGLLIILSLLVSSVTRRSIGWSLLTFTAVFAALPSVGMALVFGPAGGNQDTMWGGIGFVTVFFGLLGFLASAITTSVVGLRVLAHDWRDRHGRATAPPPTGLH